MEVSPLFATRNLPEHHETTDEYLEEWSGSYATHVVKVATRIITV